MSTPTSPSDDIASLSFEAALKELEKIVSELEEGRAPLERSIAIFERGQRLKARCDTLLREAEARVEKLVSDPAPTLVPFEEPQGTSP